MSTEQQVTIDGVNYNLADLSEDARNQIINLRFCEQKILQLQQETAVVRAARAAYTEALKQALQASPPTPADAGDAAAAVGEDSPDGSGMTTLDASEG